MNITTIKSMNLLLEKPNRIISVKIPDRMKELIDASAASLNMNFSQYVKLAINDRLEKDLDENIISTVAKQKIKSL
jgi:hypothetical protein